jgi:hypothetical protein
MPGCEQVPAPSARTSDGVPGKPEPCDYGWMGARQRLLRAETLFRGSDKPPRSPVPCTPRGEQVCRPAPTAERRFGSCLGCAAGPALVLARATASAPSASRHCGLAGELRFFELGRWVDGPAGLLFPGARSWGAIWAMGLSWFCRRQLRQGAGWASPARPQAWPA